jgi:inosine/xanthosine triphosphatase
MKSTLAVCVATKSGLKIDAVRSTFESLTKKAVQISSFDVESGVNSQPVGFDETLKGARCRLANAVHCLRESAQSADYVVAIENGVVELEPRHWFDFGIVVIRNQMSGDESQSLSAFVPFPLDAVLEAQKEGFAKITVGDVLARRNNSINSKDPHSSLTKGFVSRLDLLSQAVRIAASQLL